MSINRTPASESTNSAKTSAETLEISDHPPLIYFTLHQILTVNLLHYHTFPKTPHHASRQEQQQPCHIRNLDLR